MSHIHDQKILPYCTGNLARAGMNVATLYETTSKDKLLVSLQLAIDEANKVRVQIKEMKSDQKLVHIKKLVNLEREIEYLESTLFEIRSQDKRVT
jgi:hypothetical protein